MAVEQREENLCPGWGGPGAEAAGKERESEPTLCRRARAKGMSPTCATSSPSFKYRIGAGWAGTQFSLLQPQANAPSPRPSLRFPLRGPSPRRPSVERTSPVGQDRRTEARTATRPRSVAPLLAPARPGHGCPQHVSRRAPALRRPLPPPLSLLAAVAARLRRGRRPPPSPRSELPGRDHSLLQGFVRTAESRAQPPSRAAV